MPLSDEPGFHRVMEAHLARLDKRVRLADTEAVKQLVREAFTAGWDAYGVALQAGEHMRQKQFNDAYRRAETVHDRWMRAITESDLDGATIDALMNAVHNATRPAPSTPPE